MELKREMFFDGENIRYEEIINTVTQHPQEMKKILSIYPPVTTAANNG